MEEGASRGTEAGLLTYPLENLKLFVGKFSEPEGHEGGPQLAAVEGSLAARVEYLESLRHRVEVRYLVLQQQLLQVVHTQLLHVRHEECWLRMQSSEEHMHILRS